MNNTTPNNTITLRNPLETEGMKKQFGVFVGLYNKTNDTSLSVKQAAMIDFLVKAFHANQNFIKQCHTRVADHELFKNTKSTKLKSYSLLDIPKIDGEVLDYIENNPGESRYEIAAGLDIRLSTICGAVNRLSHNSFVYASGIKIDPETKRKVEAISAR